MNGFHKSAWKKPTTSLVEFLRKGHHWWNIFLAFPISLFIACACGYSRLPFSKIQLDILWSQLNLLTRHKGCVCLCRENKAHEEISEKFNRLYSMQQLHSCPPPPFVTTTVSYILTNAMSPSEATDIVIIGILLALARMSGLKQNASCVEESNVRLLSDTITANSIIKTPEVGVQLPENTTLVRMTVCTAVGTWLQWNCLLT